MSKLFHFQERAVQDCMDYLYDKKNSKPQVVVAPTAGGKSHLISAIANRWKRPCLVLQPSQELLEQNIGKFRDIGGEAEIYSASLSKKDLGFVTYATLGSIKDQAEALRDLGVETLFIDEAHFSYSPDKGSSFMRFIVELKPKKVIGFTATPFRLSPGMSGSQLKMLTRMRPGYFKEYLHIIQVSEIIAEGRWSPLVYEQYEFDENGLTLNSTGAEFTEDSVRKAIESQGVNNFIYKKVQAVLAGGRKNALLFLDSIANAKKMADALNKKGIASAHLDGKTSKKERKRIVSEFKLGKIKVMVNHGVLTTGFDYPELECIIMGRPTNSLALYYQIVGRGTRIHPDKKDCLYIDYCNNVGRFGKVENLVIENVEGWGWAVTNNNFILTNFPLSSKKFTIAEIQSGKVQKDGTRAQGFKMPFGVHQGKFVEDLPIGYITWALQKLDFNKMYVGAQLKKEMEKVLEESKNQLSA